MPMLEVSTVIAFRIMWIWKTGIFHLVKIAEQQRS